MNNIKLERASPKTKNIYYFNSKQKKKEDLLCQLQIQY